MNKSKDLLDKAIIDLNDAIDNFDTIYALTDTLQESLAYADSCGTNISTKVETTSHISTLISQEIERLKVTADSIHQARGGVSNA